MFCLFFDCLRVKGYCCEMLSSMDLATNRLKFTFSLRYVYVCVCCVYVCVCRCVCILSGKKKKRRTKNCWLTLTYESSFLFIFSLLSATPTSLKDQTQNKPKKLKFAIFVMNCLCVGADLATGNHRDQSWFLLRYKGRSLVFWRTICL